MSTNDTPPEEPGAAAQRPKAQPPLEPSAGPVGQEPRPGAEERGREETGRAPIEGAPAGYAPPGPEETVPAPTVPEETGRQRLAAGLWPPRVSRAQLIVAVLLFVLGLGLAIQVRSNSDSSALRGARQEDLVRILDELDGRTKRLEDEKQTLEDQRRELESSSNQAEEARKQTVEKERQLGILAGTVAAQGPGIVLKITDPKGQVQSDKLLDTLQELRAAGAEAIQINGVRIVADSYFSDEEDGVAIDGKKVTQPYEFKVIGKPQDLEPALNIPGGVVQSLEKEQAVVSVTRPAKIVVDALRAAKQPDYARSSSS